MIESSSLPQGVAIVGLSGRFPGAEGIDEFWKKLLAAEETISSISAQDLAEGEPKTDPEYVPRRGILRDAEWLDAPFFGMSRIEAEVTDPQQRIFLEVAWTALEHAGYDPARLPGVCGVWAGTGNNHYFLNQLSENADLLEKAGSEAVMIGNEKDYVATRVAYRLNLKGPAINVHTACSTSLVAVAQAVHALSTYQCDMALAGGSSIRWPQNRGYLHQEGSIFSPDGHCRAFDEASAGTVFSSGSGCVVLKRIEDAVRDGDTIYAVIRSAAINNDGSGKVSFTAPGVDGQAENVTLALALADVDASTVDYVEAHGTGTALGDVIEISALTQAFRACGDDRTASCGLGSLKTLTGHMDAAAGVGGLIKTALALHHQKIPATLHFQRPNAKLGLESSPFRVVNQLETWHKTESPRRALVAALGVGGTNAHCLLEEMPDQVPSDAANGPFLLPISARSETACAAARDRLANFLTEHPLTPLADAAYTLAQGRAVFSHRSFVVANNVGETIAALRDEKTSISAVKAAGQPVAFLFPGQGSQHAEMGRELAASDAEFAADLARCAAILGFDPLAGTDEELSKTERTQPALFALSWALARWVERKSGLVPDIMLGHSIGEYVAATLAGVFEVEDALRLVATRGRLMQAQPAGVMIAVPLAETDLNLPAGLDLCTINTPQLCAVGGSEAEIAAYEEVLKDKGVIGKRLRTSHAFHSRMMEGALEEFRAAFASIRLQAPNRTVISNVTGQPLTETQATDPGYWVNHLRSTVRFADCLEQVKNHVCLEIGAGQVLCGLAKRCGIINSIPVLPAATAKGAGEAAHALGALGKLWTLGVAIDFAGLSHGQQRRRIALPSYPFERQRYCPDKVSKPAQEVNSARPMEATCSAQVVTEMASPSLAPAIAAPEASPISRKDNLLRELQQQFLSISGIDVSTSPANTPLLDLGFDSLFLTQAGLALKKHFGVKITFRQLMEELTSIEALAGYLDEKLPAGAFAPVAPTAPSTSSTSSQSAASTIAATALPSDGSLDSRLCRIEAALAKLTGAPLPELIAPTSTKPANTAFSVRVKEQKGSEGKKIAFGPFRPVEKSKDGSLTTQQQAHLAELITAYCAKYEKTKQFTADNRPHFADPRAVGGFNLMWKEMVFPAVTDRSQGAHLWDIDGNEWIDVVHGFGSGFFGHRPQFIVDALKAQLDKGYEIGPTHPLSGEVARMIKEFSGQDRVAFSNTGSESLMAAIRVARTVTGRDKIAMFAGSYHGIFDEVLARPLVVNGELRSIPIAPGIPESAVANLLVLEYGHPESLEILQHHGHELAAVLVEPVPSRRPDIAPFEFVKEVRRITKSTETAMIFDEVVLGWRTHPNGAQALFGIDADLVAYGKVVGGGMPLGVLAGKSRFMDALDGGQWSYGDDSTPEVGVTFFAGTFIRHPLTLAACKAVLDRLKADGPALQQEQDEKTHRFCGKLDAIFEKAGLPIKVTRFSSLWMLNADPGLKYYSLLFYHLRLRGIHIWEGRGNFLSVAHTEAHCERILNAFADSVRALQEGGFFPRGEAPSPFAVTEVESKSEKPLALSSSPFSLTPLAAPSARTVPTTPEQRELILASKLSTEASLACHESVTLRLEGKLDLGKLDSALQALTERHDVLRTSFSPDGTEQHIAASVKIPLPLVSSPDREKETATEFLTPFDLGKAPLWRAKLLQFSPTEHELLITAHHTICDGWSYGTIANDLAALYRGDILEPAELYSDYARSLEPDADALAYWLEQYQTAPTTLELPVDRTRPSQQTWESETVRGLLPEDLSQKLRDYCKAEKLTPNAVLVGAWQLLLARLSGQEDIIVGTPLAGQAALGLDDMVGHLVHFLPVRQQIDLKGSAAAHLKKTKDQLIDAAENQNFTLGELLPKLKWERKAGQPSFVTNTFTLETDPPPYDLGSELQGTLLPNPKRRLGFDLSMFVIQAGSQFSWQCVYKKDLYSAATVSRWIDSYAVLLGSLMSGSSATLGQLPMLSKAEEKLVTQSWNGQGVPSLTQPLIHELFDRVAQQQPSATAVLGSGGKLSYAQLESRTNSLANELIASGVTPGSMVGVFMERSPEMVISLLAILKAGAAYAPVDVSYPAERIAFMLEDTQAPVVLTQSSVKSRLGTTRAKVIEVTAASGLSHSSARPDVKVTGDASAYIIYTSGSTGKPKGTVVPHRAVARLVQDQSFAQMSSAQTWLQLAPLSFDACTLELWAALCRGGKVALMPPGTPSLAEIGQAIRDYGVTSIWLTAGLFQLMVDERLEDLSPLQELLTGGDVVSAAHARKVLERFSNLRLINGYGPTENTTFTCCHQITLADLDRPSLPIGRPIAHTTCYVLDNASRPCPIGVPGELLTGGAGLALGYWQQEALTAEKFIQHPEYGRLYRTGDLVRWLPGEQGVIEFLGRIDTQVKIRGFRIEPGEIESALVAQPGVAQAAVVARGQAAAEKQLIAYIVPEKGMSSVDASSLRQRLQERLPSYMVPAAFVTMPQGLPLSPNGKVDVKALPEPEATAFAAEVKSKAKVKPRNPLEQVVSDLMKEALGRNSFGVQDNFFDLGGDSLQGLRLFTKIEKEFGTPLPLGTLFTAPTVEKLAQVLIQASPQKAAALAGQETPSLPLPKPIQPLQPAVPTIIPHTTPAAAPEKAKEFAPVAQASPFVPHTSPMALVEPLFPAVTARHESPRTAPLTSPLPIAQPIAMPALPRQVIPLQPEGHKTPLFCFHGGDGGVVFYRRMTQRLEHDRPIYAIESPLLTDTSLLEPGKDIAAIAQDYLGMIRQVQPFGPYLLAGYSFGGLVAYEAAQQLKAAGEQVDLVILFDTDNPAVQPRWFTRWERIRARWDMVSEFSFANKLRHLALRVLWGYRERSRERQLQSEIQRHINANRRAPDTLRPQELRIMHDSRMITYVPQPSQFPIVLVKSTAPNDKFVHKPNLGWEDVSTAPIEVRNVTGVHLEIFTEPHVEGLSQHVKDVLSRVG